MEALKDYNMAISLKPFFSKYLNSRGYVFIKTNLPENALNDFTLSIQRDPSNPEGYWGKSECLP